MNPLGQKPITIKDYVNVPLKAIGHVISEIAKLIANLVKALFDAISSIRSSFSSASSSPSSPYSAPSSPFSDYSSSGSYSPSSSLSNPLFHYSVSSSPSSSPYVSPGSKPKSESPKSEKASSFIPKTVVRTVRDVTDNVRIEGEYLRDVLTGDPAAKQGRALNKAGVKVVRTVEDALEDLPSTEDIGSKIKQGAKFLNKKFDQFIYWMEHDG